MQSLKQFAMQEVFPAYVLKKANHLNQRYNNTISIPVKIKKIKQGQVSKKQTQELGVYFMISLTTAYLLLIIAIWFVK